MLLASLSFSLMGVCIKLATAYYSAAELVFYRNLFALLALGGYVMLSGRSIRTPYWRFQFQRGLSGLASLMAYFYAIAWLPLATAVTLNYTSPLFLAIYLALFAGQRLPGRLVSILLAGFAGVVLLLQPSFHADEWRFGLVALASGAMAGVAYFNVRELGARGEPEWRTVFYFSLLGTIGGGLWALLFEFHPITWESARLLLGMGFFATVAQLAMTRAYSHGKTLLTATFSYSTVVFATLWGAWLWDESPTLLAWSGMALIVLAGLAATMTSRAAPTEQD